MMNVFVLVSFQGIKEAEHFGFISREPTGSRARFLCYVFRCAEESTVSAGFLVQHQCTCMGYHGIGAIMIYNELVLGRGHSVGHRSC